MFKLADKYSIKIAPHRGDKMHHLEVTRRHIVAALIAVAVLVAGAFGFAGVQVARAQAAMSELNDRSNDLQAINRQTDQLRKQLQRVQKQNIEIQQLIGVHPAPAKPKLEKTSETSSVGLERGNFARVQARLDQLKAASVATQAQSNSIKTLAMRVLNMRHIADLARGRMIASIPSIDPVNGAEIVGCFCYRTYPDVEFHKGVDLGADYGETVHASAAGVVAFAGWDGSYGQKVVIDHGNGYQSWYAHLSRIDVKEGQHVFKTQPIALVGSTGFSTGPHLHYQLMLNGQPVDPTPYLHGVPANVLASLP